MSFDPYANLPELPEHDEPGLLPARPSLSVSFTVRGISAEERDDLGRRLKEAYGSYLAAMADRLQNAQEWRRDVELVEADVNPPWEGAAAVRAPLTAWTCQSHATRLNGQIVSTDPPFIVTARKASAVSAARVIEEVLAAKLEECNWKVVARQVHQELPVTGNCLVRVLWKEERSRVPVFKTNLREEILEPVLGSGVELEQAMLSAIDLGHNGQAKVSLEFEDRVEYDGIDLKVIPFDRMLVFPPHADDPQDLWALGERISLRGAEIRRLAREGTFIRKAAQELLLKEGTRFNSDEDEAYQEEAGLSDTFEFADPEKLHAEYEMVELFVKLDLNRDGFEEWYWITLECETGKVLRLQYSPYQHGKCPYVMFRYLTRPGRLWGRSIAEWLSGLQMSATAAWCDQHNLLDVLKGAATSFAYDYTTGLRPETVRYQPGVPWYVKNVNGMRPLPVGPEVPAAIAVCQNLIQQAKDYADLLTATSNPALGKETDTQKTLGEVRLVLGNSSAQFEDYATGVALSWAEVCDLIRWNLAQFGERGKVPYRVTAAPEPIAPKSVDEGREPAPPPGMLQKLAGLFGRGGQPAPPAREAPPTVPGQPEFREVDASLLTADVDLMPAGLSQLGDAQSRLQRAQAVLTVLGQHPLTQQNWELQAELLGNFLRDVRAPDRDKLMQLIRAGVQQRKQQEQLGQLLQMEQAARQQAGPEEPSAPDDAAQQSPGSTERQRIPPQPSPDQG